VGGLTSHVVLKPGVRISVSGMNTSPQDRLNRFAAIVESSEDAIIGKDTDGIITDWNKGAEQLYGYSAEEAIGRPISFLIPPERADDFNEIISKLKRGETVAHYETVRQKKDGRRVDVSLRLSPIRDGAGNIIGASAVARDITERKRQEAILRESEERSRELVRRSPIAMVVTRGLEERNELLNDKFTKLFGYTEEDVPDVEHWWPLAYPDEAYREAVKAEWKARVEEATQNHTEIEPMEAKVRCKDGSTRNIEIHFSNLGKTSLVSFVDLTERKQAEEAMRRSEERLRLATQAGRMYAYEWDLATDVAVRSEGYAKVLGLKGEPRCYTRQELSERVHPEDRAKFAAALANVTLDNPRIKDIYRVLPPEGGVIWLEMSARAFFDAQGRTSRMIGIVADITERKQAEAALRESDERLRLAAQAGRMYAYEWDVATDVLVRSPEYAKILGPAEPIRFTRAQFLDKIHPDDRAKFDAAIAELTPENPTRDVTYRVLLPGGVVIWLRNSGRAFFDGQGRLLRVIGMVADVTDHKLAEEAMSSVNRRLIQAQEQERLRIARDLHDDVAQRLALLAIKLHQLQQDPPDSVSEVCTRIGELRKQIGEVATAVQTLSHELHSSKLEYLGITAAMGGFCKEFGKQQKIKIEFKSHDVPAPLPEEISVCLFRVLQEALHNSAKHSGTKHLEVRLWHAPDELHLTVRDFGAGFEPKAAMKGQGLGLTSMKERLHLVNGEISIDSAPRRGTTIHARVPLSSARDSMRAAG
jgi:PAS domain S-box-containing protein